MLRRQRDWRFAVLCLMLGLMAMRQALTLHGELVAAEGAPWQHLATFGVWSELPGLVVSFLAFGAVLIVGRMLAERDATVAAFARRERQFRSACRSASMGTFVVDLERGQMQLSPELTQMFGWTTTDEVSLARFREHLHADDVSDFDRCGEALRAGGRDLCDRLVRVRGPSGAFRHVQMIGEVQRAGEDGPSLQGVMIDVSQQVRLRAEIEALAVGESQTRTRRERLEHLVASLARALGADLAFVGELVGDGDRVQTLAMVSDGRLIDNLTYELGDTPCAGVIQGGVCVVPDRVCERYPRDALLQRVGMNGYAGKSLLDANGDEVGIVVVLTRGTFADSQFLRTLLHVYSIRLANELARGRDEDRLHLTRFALDHAGDGVFLLDERAQIVDVNESALRRFGYTQDELLQSTMADIDAEHSQAEWRQVLARVRDSGGLSLESTHRRRDGSEFPVEIVVTPLAYQGADHFCAVARDVTERRQAERDRARLEAELRQAQKMEAIGTFAGGIAHDFNNLLTAVYGNVDLARAELDDADAVAESLDAILRVARQGEAMTRRLLTFAHKAPAEKRPLDLGRLVLDTAAMLRRLQPAAIEVRADVPADRTAMVHGDESQLQQVLMNLAVNAQQAMPNGGELTLALRTDGCDGAGGDAAGKAVLSVLDTGVGMDEQTI
ncbi:MAG TPA: PAS domain S-box protein, partial [bacterium]|nr:PAS domain S-box protein [bacterium]